MRSISQPAVIAIACLLACLMTTVTATAAEPFGIRVVDDLTGRGVPLVELETINHVLYVTDSAGWAAVADPELMGQPTYFSVRSHGYKYPADGFGYRGVTLKVQPGQTSEIKIERTNIAERLYRVTGAGIYRDSLLLGLKPPVQHPLHNSGVMGSDSVVTATFNNKLYWFWGDTNLPQYPLGLFHVPGATSPLPEPGGIEPAVGVDLHYFVDENQQARNACEMPGEGPTWIDGLTVLTDSDGSERMFADFVKVRQNMEAYERGLVEFDRQTERFELVRKLELDNPRHPLGHPVIATDDGVDYVYFCSPFPYVRVPATVDSFLDPDQYEAFTCLQSTEESDTPHVIRDENGRAIYAWRADGVPFNVTLTEQLLASGLLTETELTFTLRDQQTGKRIRVHNGSLAWNEYRNQWILIATELLGSSVLGEILYAEADTPVGPWDEAIKIVTHENYSFYNPKQHPQFSQQDGRFLYFEGTYTRTFSGNPVPTPRYDYNQIMYRVDLAGPRLQERSKDPAQQ